MNALADLSQSRDLLVNLTLRELRGKYKRSVLGWSWSLLNPLATMVIFSVVFGRLLKVPPETSPNGLTNYPAFLLCGLLPWNFLSNTMNGSMLALLGNAGLIKKVYFPRQILVVSTMLALAWSFIIEIVLLGVFLIILGNMVLPWLIPTLLVMVLLAVFATGVGLILSVLNVYFRDLQYLVGIGLQLWFYATPIIYPISQVQDASIPEWMKTVYSLNPMVGFVAVFRDLLYNLQLPDWKQLLYVVAWSVGVLVVGMAVFRKFEPRLAEDLMGEVAVSVENVSKMFRLYHDRNQSLKAAVMRRGRARYEEFQALDDVSLEVPAGTTFGLVGENGSGKSTLLKCMARILRPESGTITVNGKISALLELGAGFHPELSGKENIYLNGAILGLGAKDIDRKYDEIVEFAGLEKFIDTPVKNYSSGMYVRLGFSVAINVDPDVLLVDEVLAVGDEEFQRKCNEKFAELRSQNKTIVVVSHGLGLMRTICDELAWLEHGQVRQVGPSGDVIDHYLAEVQTDRQAEGDSEGHGARWGSGEARITEIELLDAAGRPTNRLHTGEAVTIRVRYHADQPIEKPVFGLAIFNLEGILVTGPNTREAGLVPERIEGDGVVDLAVDRLMLLPGTYDISASLYDFAIVHPFDFRQRALRFDVDPGDPHETFGGVMSLGGRWSTTPGGRTPPASISVPR